MKKWHMELDISGPAVSIIRGQFVRSLLVFMTSTQLRRWVRATIRVRTPRRIPLNVSSTISKDF